MSQAKREVHLHLSRRLSKVGGLGDSLLLLHKLFPFILYIFAACDGGGNLVEGALHFTLSPYGASPLPLGQEGLEAPLLFVLISFVFVFPQVDGKDPPALWLSAVSRKDWLCETTTKVVDP